MTTEYEQARAAFREALDALGMTDEAIGGMRREADMMVAEMVGQGFPRVAAGAMTMLSLMAALNKSPDVLNAKLADVLRQLGNGEPDPYPFEAKIAISILMSVVAPDPGEMPGWGDGPG